MGNRVAGICYVKVDGTQLEIKSGGEYNPLSTTKETVLALAGVAGFKEMANSRKLKITAVNTSDFPTDQLQAGTNMTVTFEAANGKVFTLTGAWVEGEMTVNAEEGTVEITFGGLNGIER